jgi:hypothetical protein
VLVVVAAALGLLTVPLAGGRLGRLMDRPFRLPWLPVGALIAQAVVLSSESLQHGVAAVLHIATYVPLAMFLFANRSRAGLPLVFVGMALNSVAIAANDGVMPADRAALRRAGISESDGFRNSDVVADAQVPWLGDVFALPEPAPFANVFSVGDVLIVMGVTWFGHAEGESRLSRARRRGTRS